MKKTVNYAWVSSTGLAREHNEDNLWCDGIFLPEVHGDMPVTEGALSLDTRPAFAVFDGMGGIAGGGRASFLAASSFSGSAAAFRDRKTGSTAGERVCQLLDQKISDSASGTVSGTTGAFLCLGNETARVCSLGDSSVFLIRQAKARALTRSHAATDPFTGARELTRYLGCGLSDLVPYEQEERVLPGDVFLLCTDGLTDAIPRDEIASTVSGTGHPAEAVLALLEKSLVRGGYDNITIILCRIGDTVQTGGKIYGKDMGRTGDRF